MPGRTEPEHGFHALPDSLNSILQPCPLMVILWATCYVPVKWQSQVRGGIMTTDHLSGFTCFSHFGMHLLIAEKNARKIHHFTKTDYSRPGHCFRNFCWS